MKAEFDFIFGEAGSGKSTYIYRWLSREAQNNPDQNYFLFVPEQNTLKAQRELIGISEVHGMLNLDVLSFQLLFYRVLEELGEQKPVILDDIAKSLLIRKAALEAQKSSGLKIYGKKISSRGFVDQLKLLISEFYQYGIDEQKLKTAMDHAESPLLKDKLSDILQIWKCFTEKLTSSSTIPEEIPLLLRKKLADSELLKDAVLVFDGFTGFTPVQLQLLELIMPAAKRIRFAVTMPMSAAPYRFGKEDITDLFWLSRKTVASVIDLASKAGIRQAEKGETEILREEGETGKRPKEPETTVIEAENPAEEVRALAGEIRTLARTGEIRYRRMAVIVSDPEGYRELIRREFTRAEIPFFMDDKAAAIGSPAVELVRTAFALIINHYKYDDIMRYIKNPLISSAFSEREAADELDNLLRASGARGRAALTRILNENSEECAAFFEPVFALEETLKADSTVAENVKAAQDFMEKIQLSERLAALTGRLKELGFIKEAAENERFLLLITQLFERLNEVLGDEKISVRDFQKLTEAGFIDMKGTMIPEMLDMVIVGDLKRSRLDDIDILFIIGANDGLLPSQVTGGGIFTDHERLEIEALNEVLPEAERFELAPDDKLDSCISAFYLYLMMHKPNRRLIFSYSKTGKDGKGRNPSAVLRELKRKDDVHGTDPEMLASGEDALDLMAGLLRNGGAKDPRVKLLYSGLCAHEEYRDRAEQIPAGAFITHKRDRLSETAAQELYHRLLNGSVSRLETFESCPFEHFMKYGLRLQKRREFDVEALDIGNLFHNALDEVFRMISEQRKELTDIPQDVLQELSRKAVDRVTEEYSGSIMLANARNRYICERVRRITDKTLWALKEQLKSGDFHSLGTEIPFRYKDEKLILTGKIDRVDYVTDKEENRTFVKVIDYKTGTAEFDIALVLNGLQLQLTAYMDSALKEVGMKLGSMEGVEPAGMFYYRVADPVAEYGMLEKLQDTPELTREEQLQLLKLRMNGAAADTPEAVRHLELQLSAAGAAADAKLLKKSKVLDSATLLLSAKGFASLISRTKERMKQDADRILEGEIEAKPYRYSDRTACRYCDYRGICGFDPELPGCSSRTIRKMKPEEALAILEGESPEA